MTKEQFNSLPESRKNFMAGGLLFIIISLVYSGSISAPFEFDDFHQLVWNENMRSLANIPRFFVDADLSSYLPGIKVYRPMVYTSFAINYAISGYNVWSYHLFNIIVHSANAFLFFLIIRKMLKRSSYWFCLFIAAAFALHPVQTNAVTYISGRSVLIVVFFYLLSFVLFIKSREDSHYWIFPAVGCFFLGLLSKEMIIGLPVMMVAYDLIYSKGLDRKKVVITYALSAVVIVVYMFIKYASQGAFAEAVKPYSVPDYLMSEAKALLIYIRLVVLPFNLIIDYSMPVTKHMDARSVAGIVVFTGSAITLIRLRRRMPELSFFGLWFLIALLPESSFVPISDILVEYRDYFASAGLIAVMTILTSGPLKNYRHRIAAAALTLALLVGLTVERNKVWADEYSLWEDASRKAPKSVRVHANMGILLYRRHEFVEAEKYLRQAIQMDNDIGNRAKGYAHNYLGLLLEETGRQSESLSEYRLAITGDPQQVVPYMKLGEYYRKIGDHEQALNVYQMMIANLPGYYVGYLNKAKELTALSRHLEALRIVKMAVNLAPDDYNSNYALAVVYMNNGMKKEALVQCGVAASFAVNDAQKAEVAGFYNRIK